MDKRQELLNDVINDITRQAEKEENKEISLMDVDTYEYDSFLGGYDVETSINK